LYRANHIDVKSSNPDPEKLNPKFGCTLFPHYRELQPFITLAYLFQTMVVFGVDTEAD
jgi:hypothetical protein